MLEKKQNKIVILEEDHTRRDYLKSIVSQVSDLAFCFGQVANCFENLFHLNPDLIVVGSWIKSFAYWSSMTTRRFSPP